MRRLASWAGVAAVVAAALALGLRPSGHSVSSVRQADSIAAVLRCPVCQGLSVKDSDSPAARDIRDDIDRRLGAGESPSQIRQAYVDRYGDWIMLRPKATGFEALVWVVPPAVAGAGGVALIAALCRWRRRARSRQPTEAERKLVAAAFAAQGAQPVNRAS